MSAVEAAKKQIEEAMDKNPSGLLLGFTRFSVVANFWQKTEDPKGPGETVMLLNLVSGLVNNLLQRGIKREEILKTVNQQLNNVN